MAYIQGYFDSLCGLYSIINAIRFLLPDYPEKWYRDIYNEIVINYGAKEFHKIYLNGSHLKQLKKGLHKAIQIVKDKTNLTIQVVQLSHTHRKDNYYRKIIEYFKGKSTHNNTCAIIGVDGPINHWTCVADANQSCLHLSDSGELKRINYRMSMVSNKIKHKQKIILNSRETLILSLSNDDEITDSRISHKYNHFIFYLLFIWDFFLILTYNFGRIFRLF